MNPARSSGKTDREIERFGFYDVDALPADASSGTRRRVSEYLAGGPAGARRW